MREPFEVIFLRTCLVSAFVVPMCFIVCQFGRLKRLNWQGNTVPSSMGIGFAIVWVSSSFIYPNPGSRDVISARISSLQMDRLGWISLLLLGGFALLGLIDDIWGTRRVGGLQGHFRELFVRGRITTGTVKAIVGGAVAFCTAYLWGREWNNMTSWSAVVLTGTLIALSANTVNLLDVRPSRAIKGAGCLIVAVWLLFHYTRMKDPYWSLYRFYEVEYPTCYALALLLIPVAFYAPLDFRSKAMMGDVGSNALGALAGWYAMVTLSLPGQAILVALLLAFHLWTEKHSLTEFLARHPVLDWLDRVGTNRPKAEGG